MSSNTDKVYLDLREPGENLVELRKELARHPDITAWAQHGVDFEDCLGRIGFKLGMELDGTYDTEELCGKLVTALKTRKRGH